MWKIPFDLAMYFATFPETILVDCEFFRTFGMHQSFLHTEMRRKTSFLFPFRLLFRTFAEIFVRRRN